jgi:GT2 family glycosyltransferase
VNLAAIVVTYNRPDQLRVTLDRLLTEPVDHIVVVDNASTSETPALLAGYTDPRLHILRLADNTGGAGGFQAGMAHARDVLAPDWVVLMDDDARPTPGALARFRVDYADTEPVLPRNAVIAAAVFYPDGTLCEMNRPSRNPFWNAGLFVRTLTRGSRKGFHLADADFALDAPPVAIDVASFVGYFVHRSATRRAGLPEGGLFIYGDDVLYSLRIRRAGLGIEMNPAIRFEHDCGTMGEGFVYRPLWKIYYHCRNGVSIARQAAGPVVFPAALLWYVRVWWQRGNALPAPERRLYRRLFWTGLRDGLLRRRGRNDAIHALAQNPPLG